MWHLRVHDHKHYEGPQALRRPFGSLWNSPSFKEKVVDLLVGFKSLTGLSSIATTQNCESRSSDCRV